MKEGIAKKKKKCNKEMKSNNAESEIKIVNEIIEQLMLRMLTLLLFKRLDIQPKELCEDETY